MEKGNIIAFKGQGLIFTILSFLLSLFDKDWGRLQGKPWHLAIAWDKAYDGWYILEASGQGVKINYFNNKFLKNMTRNYCWLDRVPTRAEMNKFLKEHIGKKYDVAIYFFTSLAVIIRHYFNRPIPKLLDQRFSCWELVQEFTDAMNDPILSKFDVVIITDIIKALEARETIRKPRK